MRSLIPWRQTTKPLDEKGIGPTATLKQIFREFWLPLAVATVWVIWNKPADTRGFVSFFGSSFVLTSWMTGQFFRIRKQEGVQRGLGSVEMRLQFLVKQLEDQAREISSYTTGGDSYCHFGVGFDGNKATLTVVHHGKFPLYNARARICDLSKLPTAIQSGNFFAADINFHIGDISPSQAMIGPTIDLGAGDSRDFNIFFSARNGFFDQLLRFRRVDGRWSFATTVNSSAAASGANPVLREAPHGYPLDNNGNPEGLVA